MTEPFLTQFIRSVTLKRDKIPSSGVYPFTVPAVRNLHDLEFHPAVTYFVGENGTGKSTLLEALAIGCGFNAEGGTQNFAFGTRASHSDLHNYLRIVRGVRRPNTGFFLRAESFFNVASYIDDVGAGDSYGGASLHEMSHGESFWALFTEKFSSRGLYLLDEPEAALSPSRQLAALARLDQLAKSGCQFIIATHSPILMAYPHARIYLFSSDAIREIAYEDTEHYQVTVDFVTRRETMLRNLLGCSQMEIDE
jgi:predicted ATPase